MASEAENNSALNRIRGMLIGAFLGDALGAPHEFKCSANVPYTGKLEHRTFMTTRFQGRKELEIGQVTDDSEMMLALLRTIIADQQYDENHITLAYMEWANSGGWMMGKNTRSLFKGIKTIRGYHNRLKKLKEIPMDQWSQSNGGLMRCAPLALIWSDSSESVITDVCITNFHPICIDCNNMYVYALHLALHQHSINDIMPLIIAAAQTDAVKDVLISASDLKATRDLKNMKGWCLHALWVTFAAATRFSDYASAIQWIISAHPGSDTDTNACIAGALLGALFGFQSLQSDPITAANIEIVIKCDTSRGPTPRPIKYNPTDFYILADQAYQLYMHKSNS